MRTASWIRRYAVVNRPLVTSLRLELDPGEAEAIACVVEANAKLLLIDERRGRLVALRLALAKAQAVAAQHPEAVVIGSDQVADLDGQALGKPGTHTRATQQLRQMSAQTVIFQTAVAVVCLATGFEQVELAAVEVRFRPLNDGEIERYLQAEQPYDCAGSAKSEGLGISLLDAILSDDPTALVGLPLIRTCRMLRAAGLALP